MYRVEKDEGESGTCRWRRAGGRRGCAGWARAAAPSPAWARRARSTCAAGTAASAPTTARSCGSEDAHHTCCRLLRPLVSMLDLFDESF